MSSETPVSNRNQFLPARTSAAIKHSLPPLHTGKSVLITGAGGNIAGPAFSAAQIDAAFGQIEARTHDRDFASLIETVRATIPEYEPSETLLERVPLSASKSSQHA